MQERAYAVEFHGVRKAFREGRDVLDRFTLSVGRGETVALVGPSGCGKTTALRLVNRLLAADGGVVRVMGRDVSEENPVELRRRIGYVIQEGGLLPHWTVEENVETVPRLLGWAPDRRRGRVREVLEMVNLPADEFSRRHPRELSGGQRQRVGVARALAADPDLVLMDEPFGALDPIARRALQKEFLSWKRELRKSVLLVTHDISEAFRLADRVAIVRAGQVVQVGTPREIAESPADDFVREFAAP
ncbi:MAG: ATP-binding cassette domain-containing protein [Acidobacteriota bacterium]